MPDKPGGEKPGLAILLGIGKEAKAGAAKAAPAGSEPTDPDAQAEGEEVTPQLEQAFADYQSDPTPETFQRAIRACVGY